MTVETPTEGNQADESHDEEATPQGETTETPDLAAQVDEWKRESRKWEKRAKADLKKLEAARAAMAEQAEKPDESVEAITKAQAEALRWKIAVEKKLPAVLAARLSGTTVEEIEADADQLQALLAESAPKPPSPGTGTGTGTKTSTQKPSANELLRTMIRG